MAAIDLFLYGILIFFGFAGGIFLLYYAFKRLYYMDISVIHLSADGKGRVEKDYAKNGMIGGEVDCMKLFKNKMFVSNPKKDSVIYTKKGRKQGIMYKFEKGGYQWGKYNFPEREIEPLTESQRMVMIAQAKRAAQKKINPRWPEIIVPVTAFIVLGAVIFMFFIFWKDIWQVSSESTGTIQTMIETNERLVARVERLEALRFQEASGQQVIFEESIFDGSKEEGGEG